MIDLKPDFSGKIYRAKVAVEAAILAIYDSKKHGVTSEGRDELITRRNNALRFWDNVEQEIIDTMKTAGATIAKITLTTYTVEAWYALMHKSDSGDLCIAIEALIPSEVRFVDSSTPHHKDKLEELIGSIRAEELIAACSLEVIREAEEILAETTRHFKANKERGGNNAANPGDIVTTHAALQWVKRVRGIYDSSEAASIVENDFAGVDRDVKASFKAANKVWEWEHNGCLSHYYFHHTQVIFFIVVDNVIVTLYEKDFGFTQDINRMITQEQLRLVRKLGKEVKGLQIKNSKVAKSGIIKRASVVALEIEKLKKELADKQAELQKLNNEKGNIDKELAEKTLRLNHEAGKLFKKNGVATSS